MGLIWTVTSQLGTTWARLEASFCPPSSRRRGPSSDWFLTSLSSSQLTSMTGPLWPTTLMMTVTPPQVSLQKKTLFNRTAGNNFFLDGPASRDSVTPDNDVFKSLAQTYANNHLTMFKGSGICGSDNFPGGITNGASWYVVAGGMQVRRLYSTLLKLVKLS